ncbi:5750_t:CDS:2 [Funneliformis geosporum]|nr:5750_t:CDS:2 [Funneliformis geosporum]
MESVIDNNNAIHLEYNQVSLQKISDTVTSSNISCISSKKPGSKKMDRD